MSSSSPEEESEETITTDGSHAETARTEETSTTNGNHAKIARAAAMVTEKQGKGVSAKSTTPKPREIKERSEVRTVKTREVKERIEYEQDSQEKSKKEASTNSTNHQLNFEQKGH